VYELHKKIIDKIARNNANYDLRADVKNFNGGEAVKKLHACSANPFQILHKLNDNIYVIDFSISSTLNTKDLVDYKSLNFIQLVDKPLLSLFLRDISFLHSNIFYLI